MTDTLALLAVAALGYFMILDFEPSLWFKDLLKRWFGAVHVGGITNKVTAWVACVGLPAVAAGIVGATLRVDLLNFLFDALVLLLTTAVGSFMRYHKSLLRAMYANDSKLASQIANDWEKSEVDLEDGKEVFAKRMLGLCALRLHRDVLSVLFWYMFFGPAGAVLIAAHNAFSRDERFWSEDFRLLNSVADAVTTILFGVVGNMRAALEALPRLDVAGAALGAAGLGDGDYDIEQVPQFGNLLLAAFFLGVGGAATLLVLFVI